MLGDSYVLARLQNADRIAPDRLTPYSVSCPPLLYSVLGSLAGGVRGRTALALCQYLGTTFSREDLELIDLLLSRGGITTRMELTSPTLTDEMREYLQPYWDLKKGKNVSVAASSAFQPRWRYEMELSGGTMSTTSPCAWYQTGCVYYHGIPVRREGERPLSILELYTTHPEFRLGMVWRDDGPPPRVERALLREMTDNLTVGIAQYTIPAGVWISEPDYNSMLMAEGIELDAWYGTEEEKPVYSILTECLFSLAPHGDQRGIVGEDHHPQITVGSTVTVYYRHQPTDTILYLAHLEC